MQTYAALGQPTNALPHVPTALAIADEGVAPALRGSLRYAAARTLYDTGEDKARGIALARRARDDLRDSERPTEEHVEAVTAWLDEVGG